MHVGNCWVIALQSEVWMGDPLNHTIIAKYHTMLPDRSTVSQWTEIAREQGKNEHWLTLRLDLPRVIPVQYAPEPTCSFEATTLTHRVWSTSTLKLKKSVKDQAVASRE